jgi:hypothetical protein
VPVQKSERILSHLRERQGAEASKNASDITGGGESKTLPGKGVPRGWLALRPDGRIAGAAFAATWEFTVGSHTYTLVMSANSSADAGARGADTSLFMEVLS